MSELSEYDVIVVGGGGAGMSAAIEAHDAGARVALLEADTKLGGSTSLSGGVFYAAGTSVQKQAGIEGDTADDMFEYYMTLNQHRVEASCARAICDNCADSLEWLMGFGVKFPVESLYASGVESVPRGHMAEGNGAAIAAALDVQVSKRNIDVALNTRVEELIVDRETGRVHGVVADGEPIRSAAVVIASGGFGANSYLINRYYPDAARHGDDWVWYIGSPRNVGDGLMMGEAAGADITGYNRGLLLSNPNFKNRAIEGYSPGWLVFVNREGRRFVKETTAYAAMSSVIHDQTGYSCHVIFDDAAKRDARPSPTGAMINWENEEIDRQVKNGRVHKADTLEELEQLCGMRRGGLVPTIEQYNKDVAAGRDSLFYKDPGVMRPVSTPPFYGVELRPSTLCLTSTGLRIDSTAHVLNRQNQTIRGLYAAGETTGGVMGDRYIGGGNSIANAICFGRIAGQNAGREFKSNQ